MRAWMVVLALGAVAGTAAAAPPADKADKSGKTVKEKPAVLSPEEKKALADAEREAKKEHDEAVKKAIDDYKKGLREVKTDNDQAAAILKLAGQDRDHKIVALLSSYLSAGGDLTRSEAIGALRAYRKDPVASQALIAAIPANKTREQVLDKLLSALGAVGHESALPVLLDHLKDNDAKTAAAAAKGLGDMNSLAAIEALMSTQGRLEKERRSGGGVVVDGKNLTEERYRALTPVILAALKSLSGQALESYADYEKWWIQGRAGWKPKPEAEEEYCPLHPPKLKKGDRLVPMAPMGGILREFWRNIPGAKVKDLTGHTLFSGPPALKSLLNSFDAPASMGDNYGTRIRGYLYPPVDGSYVFAIAADDSGELWLSTDDSPEKKALVASVETPTKRREWGEQPSQQSSPVILKGGHVYYIEALHKEGAQNDHVSVAWKLPGTADFEVIPGARLSPFAPPGP